LSCVRLLGVEAVEVFRTTPEKFSMHVSIAISLCNSGLNVISASVWVWNLVSVPEFRAFQWVL
jgi:hypothetical protein